MVGILGGLKTILGGVMPNGELIFFIIMVIGCFLLSGHD
jgi:hypothetical protein